MSARIPSKIPCSLEHAVAHLVAHATLVALLFLVSVTPAQGAEEVRVYFDFEAQAFALRCHEGNVETLSCASGQVLRRAIGKPSPAFQAALAALDRVPPATLVKITRETISEPGFYFIVHPRFTLSGYSRGAAEPVRAFLAAVRQAAMDLPAADLAGLYVQAIPASVSGDETRITTTAAGKISLLAQALAQAPFPVSGGVAPASGGFPKESTFGVGSAQERSYCVTCWGGAPFSVSDWLLQKE